MKTDNTPAETAIRSDAELDKAIGAFVATLTPNDLLHGAAERIASLTAALAAEQAEVRRLHNDLVAANKGAAANARVNQSQAEKLNEFSAKTKRMGDALEQIVEVAKKALEDDMILWSETNGITPKSLKNALDRIRRIKEQTIPNFELPPPEHRREKTNFFD